MSTDGAEKANMPRRVNGFQVHCFVELSVRVDAGPNCHDFLQGNARPTNSASARAGNRVDYTTGFGPLSGPLGNGLSYISWQVCPEIGPIWPA